MKRVRTLHVIYGCAALGLLLLFGGGLAYVGMSGFNNEAAAIEVDRHAKIAALSAKDRAAKDALALALKENTPFAWENAETAIAGISDERTRELLFATTAVKRMQAYGRARDLLLDRADQLAQFDEKDPRIAELLAQAKPLQEKTMAIAKSVEKFTLPDSIAMTQEERTAFEVARLYETGYTYFAQLWFTPKENSTETGKLFQQSLRNFSQIFALIPHDQRTERAIEALYDRQKGSGASAPGDGQKPRRAIQMPAPASSPGSFTPGI